MSLIHVAIVVYHGRVVCDDLLMAVEGVHGSVLIVGSLKLAEIIAMCDHNYGLIIDSLEGVLQGLWSASINHF